MKFHFNETSRAFIKRAVVCFMLFVSCLLIFYIGGVSFENKNSAFVSHTKKTITSKTEIKKVSNHEQPAVQNETINTTKPNSTNISVNSNAPTSLYNNDSLSSNSQPNKVTSYVPETVRQFYENAQTTDTSLLPTKELKKEGGVTIIYYHAINDIVSGIEELFVTPAAFESQIQYLKDNGYTAITFDELNNAQNIKNPVIITFDDGYEDNYTNAYPILKKYGFKATIFICSSVIDQPAYLKTPQIQEMSDIISFQSHTLTHPNLNKLKPEELDKELSESKAFLEGLTQKTVNVLAYPTGYYNSKVISIVSKYYKFAVTTERGFYYKGDNSYTIKRIYVPRQLTLQGFAEKINSN